MGTIASVTRSLSLLAASVLPLALASCAGTRGEPAEILPEAERHSFTVCNPTRISTGFGTFANACSVTPAGIATCTVSNLSGAGGVLVHCQAAGVATVTIRYDDAGTPATTIQTVDCQP